MAETTPPNAMLLAIHEDRLREVEKSGSEVYAEVKVVSQRVETFEKHVTDQIGGLTKKIDRFFEKTDAQLEKLAKVVAGTAQKVETSEEQIEEIRKAKKSENAKISKRKKAIVGIVLLIAGSIAKDAGSWLWERLVHFMV